MEENKINEILLAHSRWIAGGKDGVRADLRGANLRGFDLQGADLRRAFLQGADLRRAFLQGVDLREANLQGADLRRAFLQGADLTGADLTGADLTGADLTGADLTGADLTGADLISGRKKKIKMKRLANRAGRYALNILVALDQLINAVLLGDPKETISGRVGRVAPNSRIAKRDRQIDVLSERSLS